MAKQYTREQLWKLYQALPEDLREAMWSPESAESIQAACERNGVEAEKIPKITEYVGNVLLGILPPEDFQKTLQKEVGFKNGTAKKVAQEIYRHIFFPVRGLLEELYKVDIAARLAKPSAQPSAKAKPAGQPREEAASEETAEAPPAKAKPKKPDVYREEIE